MNRALSETSFNKKDLRINNTNFLLAFEKRPTNNNIHPDWANDILISIQLITQRKGKEVWSTEQAQAQAQKVLVVFCSCFLEVHGPFVIGYAEHIALETAPESFSRVIS